MEKDNIYTEQVEAEINQVIAQMRSNPTPELLEKALRLSSAEGVSPSLLADLNQAIVAAALQLESSKSAGVVNHDALNEKQPKSIDDFRKSLGELQEEINVYKKALADFQLNLIIAGGSFIIRNTFVIRDKKAFFISHLRIRGK